MGWYLTFEARLFYQLYYSKLPHYTKQLMFGTWAFMLKGKNIWKDYDNKTPNSP